MAHLAPVKRSELLLFRTLDLCHGSVALTLCRPAIPVYTCECMGLHFMDLTVHIESSPYNYEHVCIYMHICIITCTSKHTLKTQSRPQATWVTLV